jgi:hypothetical protein
MYKPNFCSECGERVERERWRIWTSPQFCQLCDRRFRRRRFVAPLIACLTLFAVGVVLGRVTKPGPRLLVIESNGTPRAPLTSSREASTAEQAASESEKGEPIEKSSAEPPTDPNEVTTICGARTKKGTACQRRVRGIGRCWQHRGKPAMLPQEKLVVPG